MKTHRLPEYGELALDAQNILWIQIYPFMNLPSVPMMRITQTHKTAFLSAKDHRAMPLGFYGKDLFQQEEEFVSRADLNTGMLVANIEEGLFGIILRGLEVTLRLLEPWRRYNIGQGLSLLHYSQETLPSVFTRYTFNTKLLKSTFL